MAAPIAKQLIAGRAIGRLARVPLWDTEVLGEAAGAQAYQRINFFARPQGQAMLDGTNKTLTHTNLTTAGQLGQPNQFLLMGFRFKVTDAVDADEDDLCPDVVVNMRRDIRARGVLRFGLGGRIFYEIPLNEIPDGVELTGFWTPCQTSAVDNPAYVLSNGMPEVNTYYTLKLPRRAMVKWGASNSDLVGYELIDSTTPINCTVDFSPVLNTAQNNFWTIQVQLVGVLLQNIG